MSIEIKIVGDTLPEIIAALQTHLEIFTSTRVSLVDKADKEDNTTKTDAAPAAATPPEVIPPETAAASAPSLPGLIDMVTQAYKTSPQESETRAKIIAVRDALGIKYLSHAKEEHVPALVLLVQELGLL